LPSWTPGPDPTIGEPADDGARIIAVDAKVVIGSAPVTRARDLTIDSPAVGIANVRLFLPSGFDAQSSTRWPMLYLLVGSGGDGTEWTDIADVGAMTAQTGVLIVIPDAGVGGYYTDWWNGGNGGRPMWETFHLVELRQLLERNWHAGDKRAVAGYSMGGYGAMEYAERKPGMFVFAASYSGVLDPYGGPGFRQLENPPNALWGDPVAQADIWKTQDPTTNAAALQGTGLYVAYGNGDVGPLDGGQASPWDPTGAVERECATESAAFVQRLAALKIPVTVEAYGPGTHFGPYFERDLQRSLPLILEALGE
jgi:S-formylglutathione hydrolase FrmB